MFQLCDDGNAVGMKNTLTHKILAGSAVAVLSLGVAACSDDDGNDDDIDNPVDGVDDQLDDLGETIDSNVDSETDE